MGGWGVLDESTWRHCRDPRGGDSMGRAARFVLFDSRCGTVGPLAAGQHAIDVDMLREPDGFDPFEALVDERSMAANWPIGGLHVSEEIARVDKRAVRRRIMARLRNEVEQAGGIWLRVAPYPFPYRSALNFRIDYDEFAILPGRAMQLVGLLDRHHHVDVAVQQQYF